MSANEYVVINGKRYAAMAGVGATTSSGEAAGPVMVMGQLIPGIITTPVENNLLSGAVTGGIVLDDSAGNGIAGWAFSANPTDYAEFRTNFLNGYVETELLMRNDEIVIYPEDGEFITDIYGVGVGEATNTAGYCVNADVTTPVTVAEMDAASLQFSFQLTDQVKAVVMKLVGYTLDVTNGSGEQKALLTIMGRR